MTCLIIFLFLNTVKKIGTNFFSPYFLISQHFQNHFCTDFLHVFKLSSTVHRTILFDIFICSTIHATSFFYYFEAVLSLIAFLSVTEHFGLPHHSVLFMSSCSHFELLRTILITIIYFQYLV